MQIFFMRTTKSDQTSQAELSLRWAQMSEGTFSAVAVHLLHYAQWYGWWTSSDFHPNSQPAWRHGKYVDRVENSHWLRRNVRKHAFGHVRPVKIQISLRICAGWSESSLGAWWIARDAIFLHADKEDWSDCANAQADLSLPLAHMSGGTFSHVATQMFSF